MTFKAVRLHCNVDLNYLSMREDSGNAHSKENPSFVAGAVGGCGSVWLEPDDGAALRFDDFVSRPIASTVSAGGCHGRRFIAPVPSDFVGCIACPATIGPASVLWDRFRHGKTVTKSCQSARRHVVSDATPRPFPRAPKGLRLTGKIVHAASIPRPSGDGFEPVAK